MFALPSDTENSDTDQDDGAYEELNELRYNDMIDSSEPRSASTSRAAHRQSSADIPAMQDDAVSFSSDSDGTSDDDYSRNDIVVDGNDVWCSKTDQFGTLPEFDDEHACSDVCLITSQLNLIISDHCSMPILCKILSTRLICMHSRKEVNM